MQQRQQVPLICAGRGTSGVWSPSGHQELALLLPCSPVRGKLSPHTASPDGCLCSNTGCCPCVWVRTLL